METNRLFERLALEARLGNPAALKELLSYYGIHQPQRWSPETLRVRWDGAGALLRWWSKLPVPPLLDTLNIQDGQRFVESLSHLTRPTQRTYLKGARAALKAIHWGLGRPVGELQDWAKVGLPRRIPTLGVWALSRVRPRIQQKLNLLRALMECGLSLPRACAVEWEDLDLASAWVATRSGRVRLGARTIGVLRQGKLDSKKPEGLVLRWKADTARRWVKKVKIRPPLFLGR